jgi:hypothetical protein
MSALSLMEPHPLLSEWLVSKQQLEAELEAIGPDGGRNTYTDGVMDTPVSRQRLGREISRIERLIYENTPRRSSHLPPWAPGG